MRLPLLALTTLAACTQSAPAPDPSEAAAPATPQALYATRFIGDYAPQPICLGQEFVLSLMSNRVNIGETGCAIASVGTSFTADLQLNLTSCNAEGEPAADRSIFLSQTPGGGVAFQSSASSTPEFLSRCTDIN